MTELLGSSPHFRPLVLVLDRLANGDRPASQVASYRLEAKLRDLVFSSKDLIENLTLFAPADRGFNHQSA